MAKTNVDAVDKPQPKVVTKNGIIIGVDKLRVRAQPDENAEVLSLIPRSTEVVIYPRESVKGWYSICTASGISGFCMKQYIGIKK